MIRLSISLIAAACAATLGCGSSNEEDERPSPGSAAGSLDGARYSVPVPEELEPWATYPVEDLRFERNGEEIEIRYPFPRWLSGESETLVLTGSAASDAVEFDVIVRDIGAGVCQRSGRAFTCREQLPDLEIDRDKARERMLDANLGAAEIEQRLRVTDLFRVDPIGVLEFELE
jgi:hypothetical protein